MSYMHLRSSLLLHLTQIKRAQSLMLFRVSFEFVTEEKDKHSPSSDWASAWSPASNHHNLLSSLIPFTLIVTCLLFDNRIHLRSPIIKMRLIQTLPLALHPLLPYKHFILVQSHFSIYPCLSIPIAHSVHPFSACPLRMNRTGKAEMVLASRHYSWSVLLYLLGGQQRIGPRQRRHHSNQQSDNINVNVCFVSKKQKRSCVRRPSDHLLWQ